ncbi:MAG: hypothetical protein Q9M39_03760 [Sulfurovum sp.]|nr:hypothetical protein [Sulfurovum sp.]
MSFKYINPIGTDLTIDSICRICGGKYKQSAKGRFKEYCSDDCKNYFKFLSALDRTLSKINFSDFNHIKSIKTDLFGLVNCLPKKINKD